ncbi:hypothetical protein XarjCFBP7653_02310 [Xanthomonas arboricola]|nr:hypothetical protein XarjCFBP7653_02310 [Xanthomonas arboricola]
MPRSADTAWNRCAKRRGDRNAAVFSGDALGDACTWQLAPMRVHRGASAHDIGRTPPRKTAQSLQSIAPLAAVDACGASLQQLRHCSADACIGSR